MMVVGKDDLGLTLSLACTTTGNTTNITPTNNHHINLNNHRNHHMGFLMMINKNNTSNNNNETTPSSNITFSPLQLNLMTTTPSLSSSISTPPVAGNFLQKLPWNRSTDSFPASDRNSDSTVSTVSGKRSSGERDSDEIEVERASSRGMSDEEDGGENCRKKLRLTKDQSATLEESFKEHNTLNPKQKQALAKRLGLRPRQVEVWFQNRRARTKLKQTEVDCEFLKRCCEKLTEENRRLQKEAHELRTLKMSPQMYMQMTPPTTLTMCPSCERVAAPPSSAQPHPGRPTPVNMWPSAPFQIHPRS